VAQLNKLSNNAAGKKQKSSHQASGGGVQALVTPAFGPESALHSIVPTSGNMGLKTDTPGPVLVLRITNVFSVEQDRSENEACRLANDKEAGRGAEEHRPRACDVLEDESSVEKQVTDAENENTPISFNGSDSSQSSGQDELASVLARRSVTSCSSSTSALLDASNEESGGVPLQFMFPKGG
jgi:hypothetical protein